MNENIVIRGARTHNLKNLDVEIPAGKYVVITGVSGSGKSSLALDTLYAEGQRRYVESLSTYARQFLDKMEKPDVDSIEGIYPAIAIQQRTSQANPRSTVATVTEVYDYLRLLYARIGRTYCYNCGEEVRCDSPSSILAELEALFQPEEVTRIGFLSGEGLAHQTLVTLKRKGFYRVVYADQVLDIDDFYKEAIGESIPEFYILVDRVRLEGNRQRIADALETAFREGKSTAIVEITGKRLYYSDRFECRNCRIIYNKPDPRAFSFNSPYGACPKCQGFGNVMDLDPGKIIPDESLSLEEYCIAPWNNSEYKWMYEYAKDVKDLPQNIPIAKLNEKQRKLLWEGKGSFLGIRRFFENLQNKRYKVSVRIFLARYRGYYPCQECNGERLKRDGRIVRVGGKNISQFCSLDIRQALDFIEQLSLTPSEMQITEKILPEIKKRLKYLIDVGLEYLTLQRRSGTLSGGEAQRINLASCLGSSLVGTLYILDEPSVGLHARDISRLGSILQNLRDIGNTVVVVEHDQDMIQQADHIIDLGPRAGEHGGRLVFSGTTADLYQFPGSLTAQYLRGEKKVESPVVVPGKSKKEAELVIHGAKEHNLKNITVRFPLKKLVCVTGVSGSGKSTLVQDILYPAICQDCGEWDGPIGAFDRISGVKNIQDVVFMDQSPPSRSSKSVPATYLKFFDDIRHLLAMTNEAKKSRLTVSDFSFNIPGGRCEACEGEGSLRVGMLFLADVTLVCDSCKGQRYQQKVLDVKYKDKNIFQILNLTITEAMHFFANQGKILEKLYILSSVGLEYLRLGQATSTLSGGEAQRLKLAYHLSQPKKNGVLYIFDEPTIGLHFDDITKLLRCFRRLIQSDNSILCIEHNLDLIAACDYIIDLGPEGGQKGGSLVAEGPPEMIARHPTSITGRFLKQYLRKK
ncbi:excinuclease ABC subunit UvrA [bacterium]|nr:excinuclease ABC subunit UvrA [bacterium]